MMGAEEKFNKDFDGLHWTRKAKAMGALKREEEMSERQEAIRKDVERYGDKVIEITEFANYHIVKYRSKFNGETKERYQVYINGERCSKVTGDPKMILLIALAEEYDGVNSQAATLVAKMLGMKNDWTGEA